MLTAIRRAYPNAFVAWAVESPTQQLLRLHPDLDETIEVPKGWMRKPATWLAMSKQLKSYHFDVAIDPQGITKSAALARISGAKIRVGIRGRWGRELSPRLNNRLVETIQPHIVDRSLELLRGIGIEDSTVHYDLPACKKAVASAEQMRHDLDLKKPFVMINPGASWVSKRWEMDRFGAVASYLKRQHNLSSLIVWAGAEEQRMAEEIFEFDTSASVIAGATNLRELAVLAQQASFFVGSDTGPLHIAAAMGTPCIGLYGTTRPEESGAHGAQHIAIQKWYQSGSCRKRRAAENDAMRDIMARDVFNACDELIARLDIDAAPQVHQSVA